MFSAAVIGMNEGNDEVMFEAYRADQHELQQGLTSAFSQLLFTSVLSTVLFKYNRILIRQQREYNCDKFPFITNTINAVRIVLAFWLVSILAPSLLILFTMNNLKKILTCSVVIWYGRPCLCRSPVQKFIFMFLVTGAIMTACVQLVTNHHVFTFLCVYVINILIRTRLEPGRPVYPLYLCIFLVIFVPNQLNGFYSLFIFFFFNMQFGADVVIYMSKKQDEVPIPCNVNQ